MTKPDKKNDGKNGIGSKMRVTAAWQGDRRTAQRDAAQLARAWRSGGFDAVYRKKTELRDKRFGR